MTRHELPLCVLTDLKERFEQVLAALEDMEGWVTARVRPPVLILGSLEGVETGIPQLVRRRPLETQEVQVAAGVIRVPTLEEMARIKGWLVLQRNATRDYLDFVALAERLGAAASDVVLGLDDYYADQRGHGGQRIATQLGKQLAEPAPYDLSDVDLRHYRQLQPKWQDWAAVEAACRTIANALLSTVAATEDDAGDDHAGDGDDHAEEDGAGDDAGPRGQHRGPAE